MVRTQGWDENGSEIFLVFNTKKVNGKEIRKITGVLQNRNKK
jgi:hypothetical protein